MTLFLTFFAMLLVINRILDTLRMFDILDVPRRFMTCLNGLVMGRLALLMAGFLKIGKNASPFHH